MENVAINTDTAGNRTMHKGRSRDRIDLAVCLWMAISRLAHEESETSWWGSEEAEEAAGLFAGRARQENVEWEQQSANT